VPVYDLNDYIPGPGVPGTVTSTCFACGVTEPHGHKHVCAQAGEAKRTRRRATAAKRLNRFRKKLGRPGRISERCDLCGRMVKPDEPHFCLPDPRPSQPQFAAPWITSTEREAPPMFGTPTPNPE
jgi:hypothetical protein